LNGEGDAVVDMTSNDLYANVNVIHFLADRTNGRAYAIVWEIQSWL